MTEFYEVIAWESSGDWATPAFKRSLGFYSTRKHAEEAMEHKKRSLKWHRGFEVIQHRIQK